MANSYVAVGALLSRGNGDMANSDEIPPRPQATSVTKKDSEPFNLSHLLIGMGVIGVMGVFIGVVIAGIFGVPSAIWATATAFAGWHALGYVFKLGDSREIVDYLKKSLNKMISDFRKTSSLDMVSGLLGLVLLSAFWGLIFGLAIAAAFGVPMTLAIWATAAALATVFITTYMCLWAWSRHSNLGKESFEEAPKSEQNSLLYYPLSPALSPATSSDILPLKKETEMEQLQENQVQPQQAKPR